MARLPLLVTIPYAPTPSETVRHRNHRAMAIALVGSALAIYLVVFIVRLTTAK
jgi:hypothetical protein